jgi:hypothetical protein
VSAWDKLARPGYQVTDWGTDHANPLAGPLAQLARHHGADPMRAFVIGAEVARRAEEFQFDTQAMAEAVREAVQA